MTAKEIIHARREDIFKIAARHGVSNIRLFGSVARGQEQTDSDIDFLIDVTGTPSAWFPVGLVRELEELLARRVEVVTERALNSDLRERVLSEAVPL